MAIAFSSRDFFLMASGYLQYCLNQNEWNANLAVTATLASLWKFISQCHDSIVPFLSLKLGDGSRIRFLEDLWVGRISFKEAFPWHYNISSLLKA